MINSMKKRWKLCLALAIVILVILAGLISIIVFKIDNVIVTGNERVSENLIRDNFINGPLGDNMLVLKMKDKFKTFDEMPAIRDYDLIYEGNDQVTIQVYEKALVAGFDYMGEYIYFDKDGLVLETTTEKLDKIPLIEGVAFTNFAMNQTINVENSDQIGMILDVSELVDHYNISVKKIKFNENYELTLVTKGISVYFGKQKLYDEQFAAIADVLKTARKNKLKGTIDMRNYKRGDRIILKQRAKS